MLELADSHDSKSCGRKAVRVQVSPRAPREKKSMTLLAFANLILSSLTIAAQAIVIFLLAAALVKKQSILNFGAKHALAFSFIVALTAVLGSLFYSEIAGFEPCKLCWLQRIFVYPQVIILGLALWKKDKNIAPYSIALSVIGIIIAGYHYLLQIGAAPAVACQVVGFSVSCARVFTMNFGYITIPLMSFTASLLILSLMLLLKKRNA